MPLAVLLQVVPVSSPCPNKEPRLDQHDLAQEPNTTLTGQILMLDLTQK